MLRGLLLLCCRGFAIGIHCRGLRRENGVLRERIRRNYRLATDCCRFGSCRIQFELCPRLRERLQNRVFRDVPARRFLLLPVARFKRVHPAAVPLLRGKGVLLQNDLLLRLGEFGLVGHHRLFQSLLAGDCRLCGCEFVQFHLCRVVVLLRARLVAQFHLIHDAESAHAREAHLVIRRKLLTPRLRFRVNLFRGKVSRLRIREPLRKAGLRRIVENLFVLRLRDLRHVVERTCRVRRVLVHAAEMLPVPVFVLLVERSEIVGRLADLRVGVGMVYDGLPGLVAPGLDRVALFVVGDGRVLRDRFRVILHRPVLVLHGHEEFRCRVFVMHDPLCGKIVQPPAVLLVARLHRAGLFRAHLLRGLLPGLLCRRALRGARVHRVEHVLTLRDARRLRHFRREMLREIAAECQRIAAARVDLERRTGDG